MLSWQRYSNTTGEQCYITVTLHMAWKSVDLEDGEAVLTAAGRYAELAALYQYNR
jgi:hypothetical protein